MPKTKSDKTAVRKRVSEVMRLVLAGAEFPDIRQFATDQRWDVSDRQIHRYLDLAYKRLAKTSKREKDELVGRHLMQRRALYARSVKNNDLRTALQILRDEANLQGLYPPTKIAPTTPDGEQPYDPTTMTPVISVRERVARLLRAEACNDTVELKMIETMTPCIRYRMADTHNPIQMLNIQSMIYAEEQLEMLAWFMQIMWLMEKSDRADPKDEKLLNDCDRAARMLCYRFAVEKEAWRQYTSELGVDGEYILRENYHGSALETLGEYLIDHAPSEEEVRQWKIDSGKDPDSIRTVESTIKPWRKLMAPMLR